MRNYFGDRGGAHGPPERECDHWGHTMFCHGIGEFRCTRCWRVGRIYPQMIWHYGQRKITSADLDALPNGGTI